MAFKGKKNKNKGGFRDNPNMVLLKSVIEKDTDQGRLCRFYASPEECHKFAKLLSKIKKNSARIDVHIRERDGRDGTFTSGFIFLDETDGQGSGGRKGYKGFKGKNKSKKDKYAGKRRRQEEEE
jgi:hypothetical protein